MIFAILYWLEEGCRKDEPWYYKSALIVKMTDDVIVQIGTYLSRGESSP